MTERIASGLKHKAITKTSEWATNYRIMGQPFAGPCRFENHPWSLAMTDDESEHIVGQKAAQMAFTEVALNKTFKAIDIDGKSVLYVLPASTPDAHDFSTSRFDPALEGSPYLNSLFTDVKNIGHKRAGHANLFIRGSRSRSQLKSIPVAFIVLDEKDEMVQSNVALVYERVSGQLAWQIFEISTPTIDDHGINATFNSSSQMHFFFRCPMCGKLTELTFPECLEITADNHHDAAIYDTFLKCRECKRKLEHTAKKDWLGLNNIQWVPGYSDRVIQGYHINQMYSFVVKPYQLGISYLKGVLNVADEQEFFNSKLGLPHITEGANVTDENVNNSIKGHKKNEKPPLSSFVTMGVDVGKWLHCEIAEWFFDSSTQSTDINTNTHCKVITEKKVLHFEELDQLMIDYAINFCVIDVDPETRKALEFAQRFWGIVRLCRFTRGMSGKNISENKEEHRVNVDRTSWFDVALGRFRNGKIILPIDISNEYKEHIKTPVRVIKKDQDGNPIARYVKGDNKADHYALARVYNEVALTLGAGILSSQDMHEEV